MILQRKLIKVVEKLIISVLYRMTTYTESKMTAYCPILLVLVLYIIDVILISSGVRFLLIASSAR